MTKDAASETASPSSRFSKWRAAADRSARPDAQLWASVSIALFAFSFTWFTGHRGLFMLDQSVVFDGGWRVLLGQVPYRDFYAPFAPVTFFVQALFFWLAGVNWTATVLPACVLNTVGALSVIRTLGLLLGPGERWIAPAAGLGVAITLQAPFGTLWIEQTSIFFNLLAMQAVAEAFARRRTASLAWLMAAGALSALAVLSKQNYGLFFAPLLVAMILSGFSRGWRDAAGALAAFGAGGGALSLLFLAWINTYSSLANFQYYFFGMAARIGQSRSSALTLARALTLDVMPNRYQIGLAGLIAGAVVLLLVLGGVSRSRLTWRTLAPAAVAAVMLPWCHAITQATTHNDYMNNLALPVVAYFLGLGLIWRLFSLLEISTSPYQELLAQLPSRAMVRMVVFGFLGAWGAAVLGYSAWVGWNRGVQQFDRTAVFGGAVRVPGLERLQWGTPTVVSGKTVAARDLDEVSGHLRRRQLPFFVMGDSTMLYGLHGMTPPQPLLYFIAGHSFLPGDVDSLDEKIERSLRAGGVRVIVRETALHMENTRDYERFPRTWAWFRNNFGLAAQYGIYQVWEHI